MGRDREKTKDKILSAVGKFLSRKGFQQFGINALAREEGVDKVLIYRYFGGLPQLLKSYANQGNFWPTTIQLMGGTLDELEGIDRVELITTILVNQLHWLRKLPVTQDVMRWELLNRNELTDELARAREKLGNEVLELLRFDPDAYPGLDLAAFGALLSACISYLVFRSKTARTYLGVDLQSEGGWKRLERVIEPTVEAVFRYYRKEVVDQ